MLVSSELSKGFSFMCYAFLLAIAILFERNDKKHTEPSAKKALQLKNISKYVICYWSIHTCENSWIWLHKIQLRDRKRETIGKPRLKITFPSKFNPFFNWEPSKQEFSLCKFKLSLNYFVRGKLSFDIKP